MIYPKKIKKGATVGIVCLSSGVLGEPFVKHELKLIEERLPKDFGLKFKYMPNALKGEEFLKKHPKPFLGFSDTTNNHLMFYQLGLATLYAPALLSDIAELGPEIFEFTKNWIKHLFTPEKNIVIESSPIWYEARTSFDEDQLGVMCRERKEEHGHEFLYGKDTIQGELLGGCLESLSEIITGERYADQKEIYKKYQIFPTREQWRDKIVFVETSEEKPNPKKLKEMLKVLEDKGVFSVARGLIIGKPQDEFYYNEYK